MSVLPSAFLSSTSDDGCGIIQVISVCNEITHETRKASVLEQYYRYYILTVWFMKTYLGEKKIVILA